MQQVEVPGLRMPRIGLGTWRLEGERCVAAVDHALALGYRSIDTAQGYHNEREVGRALRESGVPREAVFVTTKVWPDHLVDRDPLEVVAESLERLGVERIDLLLVHWPSPSGRIVAAARALARVHEAGLATAVGVSNHPVAALREALDHAPVVCNQVEYHPFLAQQRLLAECRKRGVLLAAYSPLAQGAVRNDPVLGSIAERHGCTPAQVALQWLVRQAGVVALPKAASPEHLAENLAAVELELTASEVRAIDGLECGMRTVAPEFAPAWDA